MDGDVVTDKATGLMWMRRGDGHGRLWGEALGFCENLTMAGHDDWRLPDEKELEDLVDLSRANPAIDPIFSASSFLYWSSSPYTGYNDSWYIHFGTGAMGHIYMPTTAMTRCVRGGP